MNCARSCFYQYANHLPNHLLSIELKYPDFFYHFSICFVSFYIILCKLSSFMRIYAFKRKKLRGNVVFATTALVSISLHLRLYANYCSSAAFRFPRDSVRVGFVNFAEQTFVEDFIVSQAPQTFSEEGEQSDFPSILLKIIP